jgi:hypothetical protein
MLRQFPSRLAGESRFFLGTNRGKRALALDLKQPEGLAVLHRLVETADVLSRLHWWQHVGGVDAQLERRVADYRLEVFSARDSFEVAQKAAADHNDALVARAGYSRLRSAIHPCPT